MFGSKLSLRIPSCLCPKCGTPIRQDITNNCQSPPSSNGEKKKAGCGKNSNCGKRAPGPKGAKKRRHPGKRMFATIDHREQEKNRKSAKCMIKKLLNKKPSVLKMYKELEN